MSLLKRISTPFSKSVLTMCLIITPSLCAAQSPVPDPILVILQQIRDITSNILNKMDQTPAYIEEITKMAKSWNQREDKNNFIGKNQESFVKMNNTINTNLDDQKKLTAELTEVFLFSNLPSLYPYAPSNGVLPDNVDELSYTTLWGEKSLLKSLDEVVNPNCTEKDKKQCKVTLDQLMRAYIKNASGVGFIVNPPNADWGDKQPDALRYKNFYNTVSSIASYNAYIGSNQLYKQNDVDTLATTLINQASSPDWFTQIANEDLGLVLRQILMYNSQLFVEMNRMAKVQQQQLIAQSMANTLLMMQTTQTVGEFLAARATQATR